MNTLRAGAFLLGYHEKTAQNQNVQDPRTQGPLPDVANTYIGAPNPVGNPIPNEGTGTPAPTATTTRGGSPFAQQVQNFASNPEMAGQRQMATTGLGAGAGALIGRALGGDTASMIMGAGLGGLLTYIASKFFGNQYDQAWNWISQQAKEGTLNKNVQAIVKDDPDAPKESLLEDSENAVNVTNAKVDEQNAPKDSMLAAEAKKVINADQTETDKLQQQINEEGQQGSTNQELPQQKFTNQEIQRLSDFSKSLTDSTQNQINEAGQQFPTADQAAASAEDAARRMGTAPERMRGERAEKMTEDVFPSETIDAAGQSPSQSLSFAEHPTGQDRSSNLEGDFNPYDPKYEQEAKERQQQAYNSVYSNDEIKQLAATNPQVAALLKARYDKKFNPSVSTMEEYRKKVAEAMEKIESDAADISDAQAFREQRQADAEKKVMNSSDYQTLQEQMHTMLTGASNAPKKRTFTKRNVDPAHQALAQAGDEQSKKVLERHARAEQKRAQNTSDYNRDNAAAIDKGQKLQQHAEQLGQSLRQQVADAKPKSLIPSSNKGTRARLTGKK